jgi:hypothetical protein
MNLKISLLAILVATLAAPASSFAHGQDHDYLKTSARVIAVHVGNFYSAHSYRSNVRYAQPHHQTYFRDDRAHQLDRKGDRIDRQLDRKGETINHKLDRAAHQAWLQGDYKKARQLDRKGDTIERYYDRKGDLINRKLNH